MKDFFKECEKNPQENTDLFTFTKKCLFIFCNVYPAAF